MVGVMAVALAGCSSSSDGGDRSGVSAPCGELDTWLIDGTLGGKAVHETYPSGSYAFQNLGTGRLNASWMGGSTQVGWAKLLSNDEVGDVTSATLELATTPGPRAFVSGKLSYGKGTAGESTFHASLTFDQGTVTLCHRGKP